MKITHFLDKISNDNSTLQYSFESSQLQWSRFRFIDNNTNLVAVFHIAKRTRMASQVRLIAGCEKRLEHMFRL